MTAREYVEAIEAHKRHQGITDERVERARNTGERRTPQKRASLARMRERALSAGLEPYPANY
jgi:hypothetical protein